MEKQRHRYGNGDEAEDNDYTGEDGKLPDCRNLGREGLNHYQLHMLYECIYII